jgi:hypothetical protein
VRSAIRFTIRLSILAGLVFVARRLWQARQEFDGPPGDWSDRSWKPPALPGATTAAQATGAGAAGPASPSRGTAGSAGAGSAGAGSAAAPSARATVSPGAAPAPAAPPAAPAPRPAPATPAAKTGDSAAGAGGSATGEVPRIWVEPVGGTCPTSHPVKAKLASRLFHVPGMFAYDRTRPDRCYAEEQDALADGFTRAKR